MVHKHINEETLVDYTLGNLTSVDEEEIKNHLLACEQCNNEWKNWQHLLTNETAQAPSLSLKSRIEADTFNQPRKQKRKPWQKPAFSIVSIAAIFILCIGLYQLLDQRTLVNNQQEGFIMAQHDQIPEQAFMQKPDTNQIDVIPVTNSSQVSGDVWLNEVTNEMVLKVDGLLPLDTKNYQLWLVKSNDDWNSELLNLDNGSIRVYYRGNDVKLLKYIKVSIEPLGGSLTPTGTETFYVDLR